MRDAILVLQAGNGWNTAAVYGSGMTLFTQEKQNFPVNQPQTGWMEFDPEASWEAVLNVARQVVAKVGLERLAGVALVNQRETLLIWDRATGRPIYPAIAGPDRRTEKMCRILKSNRKEPMLHYRTGLFLDPHYSATKAAWILDQVDGAKDRARKGELAFGTLDTWLLWKLTQGALHATDPSNAARTLLYDLNTGHWEPQLMATFGIPAAMLPVIKPTTGHFADTHPSWFGQALPILASVGDQPAGLFAQSIRQPGIARVNYDALLNFQTVIGAEPAIQTTLLTTVGWKVQEQTLFSVESGSLTAGLVLDWLRDGLGIVDNSEQTNELACSVPDTAGAVFIPSFTGLGAPFFDPNMRGTFFGLSTRTDRRHIVRATLEGIAHQVADVARVIEQLTQVAMKSVRVDGPVARNNFLMQFQADILGVPVERPSHLDTTTLGAAGLAAMAAGLVADPQAILEQRKPERVFSPALSETGRRQLRIRWQDAFERARGWERETM